MEKKTDSSYADEEIKGLTVLESTELMKLFEYELKDIYWAEKALNKAIPKMIKNARNDKLVKALKNHLNETEEHEARIEQAFEILGKKPVTTKCDAMEGLIKEAEKIRDECEEGPMMDAGIIAAAQKIEHYEIATYGTLRQFAETLGMDDIVELMEATLEEEKDADSKLTAIALSMVNEEAEEKVI